MTINFNPLEKAVTSLDKAFVRAEKTPNDEELRDAAIQRFEYTFELAWKSIKRKLNEDIGSAEVDAYSKKTLFREAARLKIILNPENWFDYLEKRNLTSHTYDEENAVEVYGVIGAFIEDTKKLLVELKKNND